MSDVIYYRGPGYDDASPPGPYPWGSGQGSSKTC